MRIPPNVDRELTQLDLAGQNKTGRWEHRKCELLTAAEELALAIERFNAEHHGKPPQSLKGRASC